MIFSWFFFSYFFSHDLNNFLLENWNYFFFFFFSQLGIFVGAGATVWKDADIPTKAIPSLQFTGSLIGRYVLLFGQPSFPFFPFYTTSLRILNSQFPIPFFFLFFFWKTFFSAAVGGVYTGSRCAIEDARGKKDFMNGAVAGCLTGAMVALKSNPPYSPLSSSPLGVLLPFALILNTVLLSLFYWEHKGGKTSTIVGACAAMGFSGAILEAYNNNIFPIPGYPVGFRQDREKLKAATMQKEMDEDWASSCCCFSKNEKWKMTWTSEAK